MIESGNSYSPWTETFTRVHGAPPLDDTDGGYEPPPDDVDAGDEADAGL